MGYFRDLQTDMRKRWAIVLDRTQEKGKRRFAAAELICFPLSWITLLGLLPAQIVAARGYGWTAPGWENGLLAVLVSAAVGYITNYIAIEMLFKPYEEKKWLLCWKQGLVPRNKHKIGQELGKQVATNLLNPEQIADELCDMVTTIIRDPGIIGRLRDSIQAQLKENMDKITGYLIPKIEGSVSAELADFLSPEKITVLWQKHLAPQLNDERNRTFIAGKIVEVLKRRSPELTRMLRDGLREYARGYLGNKLPGGVGAETLSDGLVAVIDWPGIARKLSEKIGEENTQNMIRDELCTFAEKFDEWLKTPEGQRKLADWTEAAQTQFRNWLKAYLRENLPRIAEQMLCSDSSLWDWIEESMLPGLEPKIRDFIASQKEAIIRKLDIGNRVTGAINRQDVREFHAMINSVAAEHLGAIQVLGYVLGALVGIIQLAR